MVIILFIMLKQDKYDQIFSSRMNHKNIEIIKKFFVFQPTQQQSSNAKPYISLSSKKNINPIISNDSPIKKGNSKFTGGFQNTLKFNDQVEENHFILKSKRPPAHEPSILQGLSGKVKKVNERKDPKQDDRYLAKTSSQKKEKSNYSQVITSLNRIRKERRKYNFQCASFCKETSHEFPKLSRKNSDNFIKEQTSNNGSLESPEHAKSQFQPTNHNNQGKISIKLLKANEEPIFKKGLMAYDKQSKDFLQQNKDNLEKDPKLSLKVTGITADNFLILERYSLTILLGKNIDEFIEIASLTKIMTCYLCILTCKKYEVNMQTHFTRVSDRAAEMPGTSADLQAGDIVTLHQLLYCLMLPSGNDASVAIAECVGKLIQRYKYKQTKRTYYETFIIHMNLLAKQLGIQQQYQNSSGLSFNPNFSTPKAISVLSALAMRNSTFCQIVNRKQYEAQIKNQRFGLTRKQTWKNTNKLLWKNDEWKGIKTGTTETAGHCLMSCRQKYLICVFNCETLNKRFSECNKLYELIRNQ